MLVRLLTKIFQREIRHQIAVQDAERLLRDWKATR